MEIQPFFKRLQRKPGRQTWIYKYIKGSKRGLINYVDYIGIFDQPITWSHILILNGKHNFIYFSEFIYLYIDYKNPILALSKLIILFWFFFQGTVVAVKKIDGSKFNINRKLLIDLKTVSYTNVQSFFPICVFVNITT